MALKKSQLYSRLWQSCDELRGGMDASQYKDYVLTLLFVKYVSDKYAADPAALIDVPPGARFADLVAAKGDKEIGDRINKIVARLANANDSLMGAINLADFNDEDKLGKGKEMVDRLTKLVAIFEGLDFGRNRAEGDDLLGDAYDTELPKKPVECIEYIVVHELLHLVEPSHGERFVPLMSRHLPRWAAMRKRLNAAPLAHEDWGSS